METKKLLETLQNTVNAQNAILSAMPDLVFELSMQGEYLNVWAQNNQELAATKAQLLGNNLVDVLPKDAADEIFLAIRNASKDKTSFGHQIHIQTPEGFLWFEHSASLKKNIGEESTVIMISRNITQRKELEEKLFKLSQYDPLTNLYNRRTLEEFLERDIYRAYRYNTSFSLCLIDIDFFKSVNDTHGHFVGDEVLKKFSQLLKNSLREHDYVGRYGGEEFILALPQTTLFQAEEFAQNLCDHIRTLKFKGKINTQFHISASIGVAEFDQQNNTLDRLIQAADSAMYLAKKSGRNCVRIKQSLNAIECFQSTDHQMSQ